MCMRACLPSSDSDIVLHVTHVSLAEFAALPEEVVYRTEHDSALKSGLRSRMTPNEVLEQEDTKLAEMVGSLDETLQAENEPPEETDEKDDTVCEVVVDDDTTEGNPAELLELGLTKLDVDKRQQLRYWHEQADRKVRQQVKLVVEPSSLNQVRDAVKDSVAGQFPAPGAGKTVLIAYDVKLSGESITYPQVRKPPLRSHYKKMMQGTMLARSVGSEAPTEVMPHDVYIILDAGKSGNEAELMSAFKQQGMGAGDKKNAAFMDRKKSSVLIIYAEDAIRDRREKVRGVGTLQQHETVHIVSKDGLLLSSRRRLKYPGTAAGSVIGPVAMSSDKVWMETFRRKKNIFSDEARVAVGGSTAGVSGTDVAPRPLDNPEPVFFHAHCMDLWCELVHMTSGVNGVHGIIDLTTGDGMLALLAIRKSVPYLGFVFSADHQEALHNWLVRAVFEDMKTEGSELYDNGLATFVEEIAEEEGNEAEGGEDDAKDDDGKAEAKAKAKAEAKAKPAAKSKANAKAAKKKAKAKKAKAKNASKKKGTKKTAIDKDAEEDEDEEEESEPADSGDEDEDEE